MTQFNGVKVFSATKVSDRMVLGEAVTDWIRSHPQVEIVDKIVTQSSDSEFHCLAITLFYRELGLDEEMERRRTVAGKPQPATYPCGCSKHKVNAGLCTSYKPGELP